MGCFKTFSSGLSQSLIYINAIVCHKNVIKDKKWQKIHCQMQEMLLITRIVMTRMLPACWFAGRDAHVTRLLIGRSWRPCYPLADSPVRCTSPQTPSVFQGWEVSVDWIPCVSVFPTLVYSENPTKWDFPYLGIWGTFSRGFMRRGDSRQTRGCPLVIV